MDFVTDFISKCNVQEWKNIENLMNHRGLQLETSRFSKGKIYGCYHHDNEGREVLGYVGSTITTLTKRWGGHRGFFKKCPDNIWSKYVQSKGGPSQFEIRLIEEFPCSSLRELMGRESFFVNSLNPICNTSLRHLNKAESNWQSLMRKLLEKSNTDHEQTQLSYVTIENISKFTARNLISKNEISRVNCVAHRQVMKFWFDNVFVINPHVSKADRTIIFDQMLASTPKFRLACIKFLESPNSKNDLYTKFIGQKYGHIVDLIKDLTRCLRLKNLHDIEMILPDDIFERTHSTLQPILDKLIDVIKIRVDQKKVHGVAADRIKLSSILKAIGGVKLIRYSSRIRINKGSHADRQRKNYYRSQISIEDGFTQQILKCMNE